MRQPPDPGRRSIVARKSKRETRVVAPDERRSFPADLPEGLKPRLRLFLSVDLVGSTAFKQQGQAWLPVILNFYRDFDHCVHKQYRAFCQRSNSIVAPPEFWKSNGDELLYTCDLVTQEQAVEAIHIWLDALNEYRSLMPPEPESLDVKSTAWIGLFPAPNSEVFFRRGGVQFRSDVAEDAILLQSEMRDQWYANRQTRQDIVRDFVGPSIDTGFRLSSWASPRRLIISVDLAFLLTSSCGATDEPLPLHFSGHKALKGVIGNAPYPAIWIPVGVGKDLRDDTVGRHLADPETIRSYCEAVIEQNYKVITPLFLADDLDDDNFGWAPPFIINQILHYWRVEKQYRDAA
jgi:hypothetical protein